MDGSVAPIKAQHGQANLTNDYQVSQHFNQSRVSRPFWRSALGRTWGWNSPPAATRLLLEQERSPALPGGAREGRRLLPSLLWRAPSCRWVPDGSWGRPRSPNPTRGPARDISSTVWTSACRWGTWKAMPNVKPILMYFMLCTPVSDEPNGVKLSPELQRSFWARESSGIGRLKIGPKGWKVDKNKIGPNFPERILATCQNFQVTLPPNEEDGLLTKYRPWPGSSGAWPPAPSSGRRLSGRPRRPPSSLQLNSRPWLQNLGLIRGELWPTSAQKFLR